MTLVTASRRIHDPEIARTLTDVVDSCAESVVATHSVDLTGRQPSRDLKLKMRAETIACVEDRGPEQLERLECTDTGVSLGANRRGDVCRVLDERGREVAYERIARAVDRARDDS